MSPSRSWFSATVCLLSILIGGCASAPPASESIEAVDLEREYSPAELRESLAFAFSTMAAVHPDLYGQRPKPEVDAARQEIEDRLTEPVTRLEFFRLVAPLIHDLGDGHTALLLPSEEFHDYADRRAGKVFPLEVTFSEDWATVQHDHSDAAAIPPGARIRAINDVRIADLLDQILPMLPGERETYRRNALERAFPQWHWSVYGPTATFVIRWTSSEMGEEVVSEVPGITVSTLRERQRQASGIATTGQARPLSYQALTKDPGGTAILTVHTFRDGGEEAFADAVRRVFTQIREDSITDLIVDLRQSAGGGSRQSDLLISHLTTKPFISYSQIDWKVSDEMWAHYDGILPWYLPKQAFHLHPKGRVIMRTASGETAELRFKPKKPGRNRLRFQGNLYVLIGPRTFSTATLFAVAMKDNAIATLVGEETGGLASHFGDPLPFHLPHTRLVGNVSHKFFVRPNGDRSMAGVLPDHTVIQSIEDRVLGRDSVLEHTMNLIRASAKPAPETVANR